MVLAGFVLASETVDAWAELGRGSGSKAALVQAKKAAPGGDPVVKGGGWEAGARWKAEPGQLPKARPGDKCSVYKADTQSMDGW